MSNIHYSVKEKNRTVYNGKLDNVAQAYLTYNISDILYLTVRTSCISIPTLLLITLFTQRQIFIDVLRAII